MSAAEKLGALETEVDDLIARAPQTDHELFAMEALDLLFRSSNALPQIVAVIEAAQGCTDWHRPEGNFVRLSVALAALDEALSPPTGGSP